MLASPVVMVRPPIPVMATVPPATPGPVPSLSARRTMLPVVTVMAAVTLTSCPAFDVRFPATTVMAAAMLTSFPAFEVRLPVVVFVAAFTFTSRPAFATKLPLVAVIAAFTFTSRSALNVRVVAAPQVTAWFTWISPFVPVAPSLLKMRTFPAPKKVPRRVPLMSPPEAAIVKSVGSSNHVPAFPYGASVLTRVLSEIDRCLPEVSMNPPLPEVAPPRAVRMPATDVSPSDQTAILPPLPELIASALMLDSAPIMVAKAFCCGPAPWKLPPASTVPPPVVPDASILAVIRPTRLPSSWTVPPLPATSPVPLASIVPDTSVVPLSD